MDPAVSDECGQEQGSDDPPETLPLPRRKLEKGYEIEDDQ
jgi:hypothetical protein